MYENIYKTTISTLLVFRIPKAPAALHLRPFERAHLVADERGQHSH